VKASWTTAVLVGALLALTGCVGDPPAPTTTTTPSGPPSAGCYDSYVDTADLSYTGVPEVVGNLTIWTSGDGTCTGDRPNPNPYTLVYSPGSRQHADLFCIDHGAPGGAQPLDAREPTYDFRLNGVSIGPDAYLCVSSR
jgi:hypothetical protein